MAAAHPYDGHRQHRPPDDPAPLTPTGAAPPYDAVIFDMDGVVTDTASVHAAAWAELFDDALHDPRAGLAAPVPFDPGDDYLRYVDGRSREGGVATFLGSRSVDVPIGQEGDAPDAWTVHGLAARKNDLYLQRLTEHGVRVFAGTADLIRRLRAGGVPVGLVTASRNADKLLAAAEISDLFDVIVDGTLAVDLALPGKPDPAMFLEAAQRLAVDPARVAVVEDAVSGVAAASAGAFGLVVGVNRADQRVALEAAGADVVVDDVALLDLGVLRTDPWVLAYAGFDPAHEGHREALTTVGNGYLGTRGAAPERRADGVHYPGTYLAGIYNRVTSIVEGREVEDEHLINAPNWLLLDVRIDDGPWWSDGGLHISDERRELDLVRAVLTRTAILTDGEGRRLRLTQRRLTSMERPHLASLETVLVADGWNGVVTVRSGVDAGITNSNVAEYAALAHRHLTGIESWDAAPDTLVVVAETSQSHIRIATAARTTVAGAMFTCSGHVDLGDGRHVHDLTIELADESPVIIDKTVAIATSRDVAVASPEEGALSELSRAYGGFASLVEGHAAAWRRLWGHFGIELDAARDVQLVFNLHAYHLLTAISPHTVEVDAGVPARGLHGEGYRGHIFWDELFVLPVVGTHLPEVSRALLDYRWRRLPAARHAARVAGLAGARFPWQSGSDGREETPEQLFNVRSGRWMPDNSRRQYHVGLAVAYNAWRHYQATDDRAWLTERGADLIIEVARLFASLATYDAATDRFHIEGVMGPDEYHDGYPDTPGSGLRDNAYTNILAAWVCGRAVDTLAELAGHAGDEVRDRLDIAIGEVELWEQLSRRLAVCFHDDVISQFGGYADLAEFDWDHYRATYGNIGRLDLILEAEGDATNRYKLSKQADVLMAVYLLGPDQLLAQLDRLDYPVSGEALRRTVDYYLARTAHGSTLSRVVHASVLARLDPARAWELFREALAADLDDTQGGTTAEGIHLGAMAGTIDIVTRAFAGLALSDDSLSFHPHLPSGLRRVDFQLHHRGQLVAASLDHDRLRLTRGADGPSMPIEVRVGDRRMRLPGGTTIEVGV